MAGVATAPVPKPTRFNPCVALHELRMRMRGARPYVVLGFYAAVASAAVLGGIALTVFQRRVMYGWGPGQLALGRAALGWLAFTQLSLLCVILPAYGAGAITMEREKRTLDMLRATLLTPWDVVTGKLAVVLAFGAILLATSIPVATWCLLLGGVSPLEVFYVYSYLFAVTAWISGLGLLVSTLLRRSIGAIALTYGGVAFAAFGTLVGIWIVALPLTFASSGSPPDLSGWSPAVWLCLTLIVGWLLFLVFRWGWRLIRHGRGGTIPGLLGAGVVTVIFAGWAWDILDNALQHASVMWLGVANPYLALSGILDGSYAQMLSMSPTFGMGGGATGLQVTIWLIATPLFFAAGVVCWALAVRIHARRE